VGKSEGKLIDGNLRMEDTSEISMTMNNASQLHTCAGLSLRVALFTRQFIALNTNIHILLSNARVLL
jgi:hypothetical protein